MKITIEAEPKEIAALVVELQERQASEKRNADIKETARALNSLLSSEVCQDRFPQVRVSF